MKTLNKKESNALGLTLKRSPSKLYWNVMFLGTVVKTFKSKYDAEVYIRNN